MPDPKELKYGHLKARLLQPRQYWDSGDYALSKAGKQAPNAVGQNHPTPENIHHPNPKSSSSPVKSSSLFRQESAEDLVN